MALTPEERRKRQREATARWRAKNPDHWKTYRVTSSKYQEYQERYKLQVKADTLIAYGGNPPKCACCGESEPWFLTLDHINGGGERERREENARGLYFYTRLRKRGWPPGYQVLCFNCNAAKHMVGICPHQDTTEPSGSPKEDHAV